MESAERIVRALSIEGGVAAAVDDGRRAVELTEAGLDELVTGALCGYARALYFAGELAEARAVALRVLEHPDLSHRVPSLIHAQATLALVAAGEERLSLARAHAEQARKAVGRLGTSRSWLGAHVSAAMGVVLAAEEELTEADRELATAERFFRDEVADDASRMAARAHRRGAHPSRAPGAGGEGSTPRAGGARRARGRRCPPWARRGGRAGALAGERAREHRRRTRSRPRRPSSRC